MHFPKIRQCAPLEVEKKSRILQIVKIGVGGVAVADNVGNGHNRSLHIVRSSDNLARGGANEKRPPFGGRGIHFLSFWQYWVHSLSVHSEHLRAALLLSQNRSGYIMMHTSHTSHARNARQIRLTA